MPFFIALYKYLHVRYSVPSGSLLRKVLPSALKRHDYKLLNRHCHSQVKLQFFTFYVAIMELPSRESNAAVNAFI